MLSVLTLGDGAVLLNQNVSLLGVLGQTFFAIPSHIVAMLMLCHTPVVIEIGSTRLGEGDKSYVKTQSLPKIFHQFDLSYEL